MDSKAGSCLSLRMLSTGFGIRLSPKSGLHANGSSQPSAATSMPCASNFALVRQPLGGFRFGTLHAYRVWRAVRRRSGFGWYQSGRWAPMRQLRPRAPAWLRGSCAEPPAFSYAARHRSRRGEREQDERRRMATRVARSGSVDVISNIERKALRRSLHRMVRSLASNWERHAEVTLLSEKQ